MLWGAIALLVFGVGYAVYIAPPEQRVLVVIVFVVLAAAGYGGGFALTKPGTDQRTFYPIAGAIAGAMIGFGWISNKRKTWPKKEAAASNKDAKP